MDRVYLNDSEYLVSVRFPGEWDDLRSFVRPNDPAVLAKYQELGPDVMACLDWVCREFNYRSDDGEMWRFPAETIRLGYGDCDDTAILLVSLLENFTNAYVAAGSWKGYGHAWGQLNRTILESTYAAAGPVPDPQDYIPYVLFNDKEVIELWPGALRQLFELNRNDRLKLDQMAQTLAQGNTTPIALTLLLGTLGSLIAGLAVSALVGSKS